MNQTKLYFPNEEKSSVVFFQPKGWTCEARSDDGYGFLRHDGLRLILTESEELDGKIWRHVSISRLNKLPSYQDLLDAKADFVGDEFEAIQVFPKKSKHINIHPYCLHLWSCREKSPLPDFTRGGQTI